MVFPGSSFLTPICRLLSFGLRTVGQCGMRERSCRVDGRRLGYAEVTSRRADTADDEVGDTVVLLHGWGLAHSSYARAAQELAGHGFRVVVPDLPGFGRSGNLPLGRADWGSLVTPLRGFLEHVRSEHELDRLHLVGHSFGGAVAVHLAHEAPDAVASLVLVDAATGVTWSRSEDRERLLVERPVWDWTLHLARDFPFGGFPPAAVPVLRDLGHNLVWHLRSLGLAAWIVCRADVLAELAELGELGVPVAVLWAESDHVVPRGCFEDQCEAVGHLGSVVAGNHGWPMTDPVAFGMLVAEQLEPPAARRKAG